MKEEQRGGVVRSSRALNLNLSRKRSKATTSIGARLFLQVGACGLLSLTLQYIQYVELNGGTSVLYFYCA